MLARALDSVWNQSRLPEEVIVINDGSIDATFEFLEEEVKKHPQLKVISLEKNIGVNHARNRGIAGSHSDWIFFLDDDDELAPGFLETGKNLLSVLPQKTGLALFNTIIKIGEGKEFIGGYQFPENEESYVPSNGDFLIKKNLRGDFKPMFRKEILDNLSFRFNEEVNGFESYSLNILKRKGVGFIYFKQISTIVHQEHETRLSNVAAMRNPEAFLKINRMMVSENHEEYRRHPRALAKKYLDIVKLAVRVGEYGTALRYGVLYGVWRLRGVLS
jgi:glycosyltransferase involved in cell wall biosynthesis